jgi:RNA polymerase sigma-70 factor (ECF subfamily)
MSLSGETTLGAGMNADASLPPLSGAHIITTMPEPEDSRRRIIGELRKHRGVEENFRRLFQLYHGAVRGYFARRGFSTEDCRDLTQEVFVAVYMGLENLRSDDAFTGWLFSIARYIGIREMERQRRLGRARAPSTAEDGDAEPAAVHDLAAPQVDALTQMINREKTDAMQVALEDLPARVRDCIRGRLVDGLNYRQIGERLGISENTVAVHIHRGLKNLRTRLKVLFGDAPFAGDLLDGE